MSPWVWIVLVVIVLAAVIGLVMSRNRTKQLESRREEAASLRDGAAEHRVAMRDTETAAAASGAEAQRAREEADAQAAQARELEAKAQRDSQAHETARQKHDEQMRRADALDPDVRTDDEGYRLDDDGNRAGPRSGHGVAAGLGAAGLAGAGALAATAGSHHSDSSDLSTSGGETGEGRSEPVSRSADAGADGVRTAEYASSDPASDGGLEPDGRDGGSTGRPAAGVAAVAGAGAVAAETSRRHESDESDESDETAETDETDETDEGGRDRQRPGDHAGYAATPGSGDEPVRDVRTGEVLDEDGYSAESTSGDGNSSARLGDGGDGYSTERSQEGGGDESSRRREEPVGYETAANGTDDADGGYSTERTAEGGYGSAERTNSVARPANLATDESVPGEATGNAVEEGGKRAGNWAEWESGDTSTDSATRAPSEGLGADSQPPDADRRRG